MIRPLFRRNWTSRAATLSGGDVIIISIPKSGRTWLRTFLCAYFCRRAGVKMTLALEQVQKPGIPRVVYSHDIYEQHTKAIRLWDRFRGKYLVPRSALHRARVVLLARDPRDAFVSHYIQLTRRIPETPAELKRMPAGEMLHDRRYGIEPMIGIMNSWISELTALPRFRLTRYESLRLEPDETFRALLLAIGETVINQSAFAHALAFSAFGNMKNMEASGAFDSKILQPGDVCDAESFKVRRGKIGGFVEYLSDADQAFAARALASLDSRFHYSAEMRG
ncbi:MAG TPA: sulfotransferase domain-containing protein [Chthoniobacterales bacterium]|nr:sulfotransferase domain-containing protein [Chthoniobacterales bacterium]